VAKCALSTGRLKTRRIAYETGGRMYQLKAPSGLSKTYYEITHDLRQIYTLSFRPSDPQKPGWRQINVQVKERPELIVNSRRGYFNTQTASAE
jgi:hypothetical protein